MQELSSIIATLGFPIAVCCYLFWERSTLILKFTEAIDELKVEIIRLNESYKESKK